MKRIVFIILVSMLTIWLVANDIQQPTQITEDFEYKGKVNSHVSFTAREQDPPPNYSFILNGADQATTYLYDSYYDYMPYSYNGHNLRIQPEISLPYGYPAGGMYISYHCSETTAIATDRRAWNSYVNPDGTLHLSSATNHYEVRREGFTSVDIDPVTADPMFCWHAIVEDDNTFDTHMTYDNFHLTGQTGYWKSPFILIDNPEASEPYTLAPDDEFIWPIVMMGDSPLEGHRRVHVYCNNFTNNSSGDANYNSFYKYADFNADSLLFESELSWTVQSFPFMDHLHYDDINRVNKDMIVNENGQVAFFGNYGDTLFCMYSDNWGENFTMYKQEWLFPVVNPFQEDGVTYEFYNNDETTPSEMYITLSNDGSHYNAVFTTENTKIVWMTITNINNLENIETDFYMPALAWPKIFSFDIDTGTFDFYDMDIQGVDPADDQPTIPWDLDEDGEVDEYYTGGEVYYPLSMCAWFYNTEQGYQDCFFHESNFKMVANNNWIVVGWHDSKKLRHAFWGTEGYDGWVKQPEIVISISDDYGETWSEPRYINANPNDAVIDEENNYDGNYAAELEDMLPVNITFGEKLEILSNEAGNYHAKLHLCFFDDNDYGSAAGQTEGAGQLNGGKLRYAALDIEFQSLWIPLTSTDDNTATPDMINLGQNYPNPFNPETTINYSIKEAADVKIEVYNIKGQKVKTLVDEHQASGTHFVTWNGTDFNNKSVSSGVYFYKMRSGKENTARKMVLLR